MLFQLNAHIERKRDTKINVLKTDNGLENTEAELNFFKQIALKRQQCRACTPQYKDVAERMNRSSVEMANCMLPDSNLPDIFWAQAIGFCLNKNSK